MYLVPFRQIQKEKEANRKKLPMLEYHAMGDCVHIGRISKSCENCFLQNNNQSFAIYVGDRCQLKCPMCYYDKTRSDPIHKEFAAKEKSDLVKFYKLSLDDDFIPRYVSFNTYGESFLFLKEYGKYADIVKKIEDEKQINIYKHIYTNGLLCNKERLKIAKEMRITEIRFHVSASDFSKKVFDNMCTAKSMGFIVTVEEPSWPLHRDALMTSLMAFNDIGVQHLNLVETQITFFNFKDIDNLYPKGRYYKNALHHLYDEGLVYEIIKEVYKQRYKYSVLDCNSDVERYRRVSCNFEIDESIMDGATTVFNFKK